MATPAPGEPETGTRRIESLVVKYQDGETEQVDFFDDNLAFYRWHKNYLPNGAGQYRFDIWWLETIETDNKGKEQT